MNTATTMRRWLLGLGLLVCTGGCLWAGLLGWVFAPLSPLWANYLDTVWGHNELLISAQWLPDIPRLSPDGRRMLVGWDKGDGRTDLIWDLATDAQYPITVRIDARCWLNSEQFLVLQNTPFAYYLIDARTGTAVKATFIALEKEYADAMGLQRLGERWQQAEALYVLDAFSFSGPTVLTIEQHLPYIYKNLTTSAGTEYFTRSALGAIPHILIPSSCDLRPSRDPLWSPDGRYYARLSHGRRGRAQIYDRNGQLVAEAGKSDWNAFIVGWAHDSSGLYFGVASNISGSPYAPTFKLRPLTPAEHVQALLWRIGGWVGGAGLVVGGGWWLWRRRRRA